jgi:hypothetical protein
MDQIALGEISTKRQFRAIAMQSMWNLQRRRKFNISLSSLPISYNRMRCVSGADSISILLCAQQTDPDAAASTSVAG